LYSFFYGIHVCFFFFLNVVEMVFSILLHPFLKYVKQLSENMFNFYPPLNPQLAQTPLSRGVGGVF
jgi:hypothetical protein